MTTESQPGLHSLLSDVRALVRVSPAIRALTIEVGRDDLRTWLRECRMDPNAQTAGLQVGDVKVCVIARHPDDPT